MTAFGLYLLAHWRALITIVLIATWIWSFRYLVRYYKTTSASGKHEWDEELYPWNAIAFAIFGPLLILFSLLSDHVLDPWEERRRLKREYSDLADEIIERTSK